MRQLPERLLAGANREYQVDHLFSMRGAGLARADERALLCWVLPPWQREVVWSEAQQVRFIEGIFLGLGTGYYVVHGLDWEIDGTRKPMSGWLLDGQQRLTAIDRFVKNEFAIFDNIRYDDLDVATRRRRFLHVNFPCQEIPYQPDEARLKELYDRLNFGGTPHTAQDRARLGGHHAQRQPGAGEPSP